MMPGLGKSAMPRMWSFRSMADAALRLGFGRRPMYRDCPISAPPHPAPTPLGIEPPPMPRIPIAIVAFLIGFTLYVVAAVTLADHVTALHWSVQALYFLV